jgi:hypothetical protein
VKIYEGKAFERFYDRDSGAVFSDIEFRHCYFLSCALSITREPRLRTTVRNVKLLNCERRGSTLHTAIVEDCLVESSKTNGLCQSWGAVFKHVTLRGEIERVMFSPAVSAGLATREEQRAFDESNAEYYKTVDWALDISEAEFEECEIQGVPASLVRRDISTQVIVTREKAIRGNWHELDLSETWWPTSIKFFLDRAERDIVLVAPKRHKKFRQLLDGLKRLRDAGVAEPK